MKRVVCFKYLLLIGLFFSQLVLCSSSSLGSNTVVPNSTSLPSQDENSIAISEAENLGISLGFTNDREVEISDATMTRTGDKVEITLNEGGKINFHGSSEAIYGGAIDSKYIDLNKKNKFVFEKGVLVEAEFKVKPQEEALEYRVKGINFFVPGDSKVVLKDNTVTITPDKNPGYSIHDPIQTNLVLGTNNDLFNVNYVAPKDGITFSVSTKFTLPLKEGTISFLSHQTDEKIFTEIALLGEKAVLGGGKSSNDKITRNTVLNDIEIKNADPLFGTTLVLGEGESEMFDLINRPYVSITANIANFGSDGNFLQACVIGCGDNLGVRGYDVSIVPDKNGKTPILTFNSGNPIFPGMTEDQSLVINSGSSKLYMSSDFYPNEDNSGESVKSIITAYSKDAKITNGESSYVLKQGDGRLEWYVDRMPNEGNNYPLTLNIAQQEGSLTTYPDTLQVDGKPVTIIRTPTSISQMNEAQLKDAGFKEQSTGDKIKFKIMDILEIGVQKAFGDEAVDKVDSFLYKLLFPDSKSRPV